MFSSTSKSLTSGLLVLGIELVLSNGPINFGVTSDDIARERIEENYI